MIRLKGLGGITVGGFFEQERKRFKCNRLFPKKCLSFGSPFLLTVITTSVFIPRVRVFSGNTRRGTKDLTPPDADFQTNWLQARAKLCVCEISYETNWLQARAKAVCLWDILRNQLWKCQLSFLSKALQRNCSALNMIVSDFSLTKHARLQKISQKHPAIFQPTGIQYAIFTTLLLRREQTTWLL